MPNVLDIILVVFFLISVAAGYRSGLIRYVWHAVSFIISIALTWLLYPTVSRTLASIPAVRSFVTGHVSQFITGAEQHYGSTAAEAFAGGLPAQQSFIHGLNLPTIITNLLVNNSRAGGALNAAGFQNYITDSLSKIVFNALAIVLVFVCVSLIMGVVSAVLNSFSKLPIIRPINKALGAAYGAGRAVVVVWIALAIIALFFLKSDSGLQAMFDHSAIAGWFNDYNPIMRWITNLGVHSA